jgi:CubicO group peptidase (beta-lactamase class C family)
MSRYVPPPHPQWERVAPEAAGFDAARLAEAARFAEAHESPWPRSMYLPDGRYAGTADMDEKPPFDTVLGAVFPRGGPAGVVVRGGKIALGWGETGRADMTFSVAKSYLAVLAGVALREGAIRSLDAPVRETAPAEFTAEQNRDITWRHLLTNTSEWEGTLWDKPDLADRNRHVGPGVATAPKGTHRDLKRPGEHWEYNDVRVNLLAYCLMQAFRRPLPEVLRETIMKPIGASDGWAWRGYRNSVVEVGGRAMESVTGGAHWGGGLVISALDQARLGLLMLNGGRWGDAELLPPGFMAELSSPCPIKPIYGLLWWLNTARGMYPSASERSIFAMGLGTNLVWLDPEHDLVVVARWIDRDHVDGLIGRVMRALAA